jgi:excisionase family DNA binding protein
MNPAATELQVMLERLAEGIAERVYECLVAHQEVATRHTSPWMGIDKAAEYLDWPKQRLYKLTASGEIPHYKHEGRLLFRMDELDRWLAQCAEGRSDANVGPGRELLSPSMATGRDTL